MFAGHLSSVLVGIVVAYASYDPALAAALTVDLPVLAMLMLRCLHPPVLSYPQPSEPNWEFLLMPLTINIAMLLLLALLVNRLLLGSSYPAGIKPPKPSDSPQPATGKQLTVAPTEIEQVIRSAPQFLDVDSDDLQQIYTRLQLQRLQKLHVATSCGDIMQRNIVTVEYTTEVESTWALMCERQLHVLPVLDRTG